MESKNSKCPEAFHKDNKTIISILGIGNEAARMVDSMQVYNLQRKRTWNIMMSLYFILILH